MPTATIIAMRSSLADSALFAEQRLAGAIIGALTAALLLFTIDGKHFLEIAIIIFGGIAVSIRGVNYALYCAAVAAAVLIGIDLSHPQDLGDEGRRVLFTFVGVSIAVIVMLIADLLQKRSAPTTTPPDHPPIGTSVLRNAASASRT